MSTNQKRKQKSKSRLDKFYHMAKDSGYRSRAAFKLIQLNKKYNFLENANSLVDLCAAPGGWLQVAEKYMPMNSVKIGVDLVKINSIPNVKTFVQDITESECIQLILREMKKSGLNKVDIVLNDGAPNVGASWTKDAYTQIELVLESFKLATKVLKKGGMFITKVFRSQDYSSLLWVLNKFFNKVEACKPEASRNQSAEIFLVCQNYLHPDYIDEKFYDSKFVFKDNETQLNQNCIEQEINSMDKLFEKRRKRQGYDDNAPQSLYKVIEFQQLFNSENPFALFYTASKINISQQEINSYLDLGVKVPDTLTEIFEDVQVLGKREISIILKFMKKIRFIQKKTRKNSQDEEDDKKDKKNNQEKKDNKAKNEDDEDDSDQSEVDDEIFKKIKERQQKEQNREKKKEEKQLIKIAKNKIGANNIGNGDEETELFSLKKHQREMKKVGYIDSSDNEDNKKDNQKAIYKQKEDGQIEENIDFLYQAKQDKDKQYKDKKYQENVDKYTKSQHNDKHFDERYLRAKQFLQEDNQDILESMKDLQGSKVVMNKKWFDQQIFQDLKKKIGESRSKFTNPLNKEEQEEIQYEKQQQQIHKKLNKNLHQQNPNDYESDEQEGSLTEDKKQKKVKKDQLNVTHQLTQQSKIKIEGEPVDQIDQIKVKQPEDYDFDELAENLAMAQKMLRKKNRENIIESSYNRYSYNDEDVNLPSWFLDDEKKHNVINLPITKQEVQVVKERLMAIQSRQPKKVLEAKWRKKIKLTKKLKKAQQKAEVVFEQNELSQSAKMKQIRSIYRKEVNTKKDEKKYIVSRNFKTGGAKGGRNVKFVDRKLKGDKKMEKRAEKRKSQAVVNPNRNIMKNSKKIQKNRRSRK